MNAARAIFFGLLLFGWASPARAQRLPDLKDQPAWGEKEKQEFLKYLKFDQQVPVTGQVKEVSRVKGEPTTLRKARYVTLNLVTDSMMIESPDGKLHTEAMTLGAKALVGGHIFSWTRYYAGLKYNRMGQDKLDGTTAHLAHYEIPVGIELALIPLGTPHTRYVLMRFGVSSHYVTASGSAAKSDFGTSLLGWHTAWNAGLGYEWQLDNSNWRGNILAEGYRSFSGGGNPGFYGLGFTAGLAYTF